MVSWNMWASWVTTPTASRSDCRVDVAQVVPADAHRAGVESYIRVTSWLIVVLPAPDGPTRATSCPASARKRDAVQDLRRRRAVQHRDRLQRGQRHLVGASGSGSGRRRTRPWRRRGGSATGVRLLGDHRLQVEHLEHPLEADQRGHHVDLHVGQRGQRSVQPGQVGGERHEGADAERARRRERAADAVDEGGGQRRDEGEATMKTRQYMALVTPMSRTRPAWSRKRRSSVSGRPNSLTSRAPETLKRSVMILPICALSCVALAGERRQPAADPAGRQDEQRAAAPAQQRDLPGQHEHRGEREHDAEDVADDAGQGGGERLLGAEHVVVEPADERAGLGAGEERDRHPLDVGEDLSCAGRG